ncbi:MAG: hypothetical protein ABJH98_00315 [Reichenbachiella sp.]|uniref:hypothetical protein n=1 Tax=Reichenbachiella sp. TaxID=2184521 RepID=UPI00329A2AF5
MEISRKTPEIEVGNNLILNEMIVWSGRGILTPLILLVALFLSISLSSDAVAVYTFPFSLIFAGVANWYLGKKWNNKEGRIMVDEATGERVEFKSNHTLFWIKMEYWGVIFSAIGVIQLITIFV